MGTTTVVLKVLDNFSGALDSYAQKTATAAGATEALGAAQAETEAAAAGMTEAETANATAAETMSAATSVAQSAVMGLALAAGVVAGAVAGAKVVYDNTIGSADTLAASVRRLSMDMGATAQDASKLVYVANIMGVSVDTLTHSIDAAIRTMKSSKSEGIAPNIEGLAKLSDMYNALAPGVERTKFLMDNFGRSGADMGELMQLGSQQIKAMGDQATLTGNVLSGPATEDFETYDRALNKTKADAQGLGVALGVDMVGGATRIAHGADNLIQVMALLNTAQKEGIITAAGQAEMFVVAATSAKGLKGVYDFLQPQVAQVAYDMAHGADASDRAAASQAYLTTQVDTTATTYSDAASMIAEYTGNVNLQVGTQLKATQAQSDYNDALKKTADALSDQAVAAGVSATVTKNEQAYQDVITRNAPKIAELRAEIAKYTAAQGESVTVVNKGQYSAEQLAVAQERLSIAEQRLNEYHGKSAASLASLQLSVRTAQDAVDKMSGAQATATTTTADYASKIAEDKAALDELTGANDEAGIAMHKANKEWIAQQAMAGLHGQALLEAARAAGVLSQEEYNLATQVQAAKDLFIKTGDEDAYARALHTIGQEADGVIDPLHQIPYEIIPVGQAAYDATTSVDGFGDSLNNLPKYTLITIETDYINKTYGAGGPGYEPHAAGGANFTVPPGYPNDSFPMHVQSGEHVIVIPAQGGGGSNSNYNVGSVHIHAAPGQSGDQLWAMMSAAAARQTRNQIQAGASVMGNG